MIFPVTNLHAIALLKILQKLPHYHLRKTRPSPQSLPNLSSDLSFSCHISPSLTQCCSCTELVIVSCTDHVQLYELHEGFLSIWKFWLSPLHPLEPRETYFPQEVFSNLSKTVNLQSTPCMLLLEISWLALSLPFCCSLPRDYKLLKGRKYTSPYQSQNA